MFRPAGEFLEDGIIKGLGSLVGGGRYSTNQIAANSGLGGSALYKKASRELKKSFCSMEIYEMAGFDALYTELLRNYEASRAPLPSMPIVYLTPDPIQPRVRPKPAPRYRKERVEMHPWIKIPTRLVHHQPQGLEV
ncbi:hypothetical protein QAD02_013508 [Eretmocerus hayati]|uniref:Uncharacterized protein n=1 Tax=Eretmocerus hayati TaxID=131215 RepID=A0ACC2P2Q6_9HYME|nr:hypothetical protein QAD02_013508 [Eretmocerus hayati]